MQVHETYKLTPFAPTPEGMTQLNLQLGVILDQIAEKFATLEGRENRVAEFNGDVDHKGKRVKNVGPSQANGDAVNREEVAGLIDASIRRAKIVLSREATEEAVVTHSVTGGDTVLQSGVESALDALGAKVNEIISILQRARLERAVRVR